MTNLSRRAPGRVAGGSGAKLRWLPLALARVPLRVPPRASRMTGSRMTGRTLRGAAAGKGPAASP